MDVSVNNRGYSICPIIVRLIIRLTLALLLIVLLLALSPIDPVSAYFDGNVFAVFGEQKEKIMQQMELEQSAYEQVTTFIMALISGNLGYSLHYQEPVTQIIWQRSQYSLLLMLSTAVVSLLVGYAIGLLLGLFPQKKLSHLCTQILLVMNTIPSFWVGLLLISLFAVHLFWFPIGGVAPIGVDPDTLSFNELLPYFVLPLITLCIGLTPQIALHTKEKVDEINHSQHVRYARMHGQSTWMIIRYHLLRNTFAPALVLQLAGVSELLSGSVIIETVFNFPGIGQTLVTAGLSGDTPLLLGVTLCCAIVIFISNATASYLSKRLLLTASL